MGKCPIGRGYPVGLARSIRAVSEAYGDPGRSQRKPRRVATDGGDSVAVEDK